LFENLSRGLTGEEADEVQERVTGGGSAAVVGPRRLRSLFLDCSALRHSTIRPVAQVIYAAGCLVISATLTWIGSPIWEGFENAKVSFLAPPYEAL